MNIFWVCLQLQTAIFKTLLLHVHNNSQTEYHSPSSESHSFHPQTNELQKWNLLCLPIDLTDPYKNLQEKFDAINVSWSSFLWKGRREEKFKHENHTYHNSSDRSGLNPPSWHVHRTLFQSIWCASVSCQDHQDLHTFRWQEKTWWTQTAHPPRSPPATKNQKK